MKIKYLYISVLIFCTLSIIIFVLFLNNDNFSNQAHPTKKVLVANKKLDKGDIKDNESNSVSDSNIDKPLQGVDRIDRQQFVAQKSKNFDAEKLPQTETEDSKVIEIGEYMEVDEEKLPQTETEDSEVIEIGEYMEVDAEKLPQTETEDSEVIEIGEYLEVDAEKLPQTETEDSEVIEIGEYMEVDAEKLPQTETGDSEVIEIGEYMEVDDELIDADL